MIRKSVSLASGVVLALMVSACTTPPLETAPAPAKSAVQSEATREDPGKMNCSVLLTTPGGNSSSGYYWRCSVLKEGGLVEGDQNPALTPKAKLLGDDLEWAAEAVAFRYKDPLVATIYQSKNGGPWEIAKLTATPRQVFDSGKTATSNFCSHACYPISINENEGPSTVDEFSNFHQCFWRINNAQSGAVVVGNCRGETWAVSLRRIGEKPPELPAPGA